MATVRIPLFWSKGQLVVSLEYDDVTQNTLALVGTALPDEPLLVWYRRTSGAQIRTATIPAGQTVSVSIPSNQRWNRLTSTSDIIGVGSG